MMFYYSVFQPNVYVFSETDFTSGSVLLNSNQQMLIDVSKPPNCSVILNIIWYSDSFTSDLKSDLDLGRPFFLGSHGGC